MVSQKTEQPAVKFPSQKAFLAWLEKRESTETFDFCDNGDCIFARFLKESIGVKNVWIGISSFGIETSFHLLPKWAENYSIKIADVADKKNPVIKIFSMREVKKLLLK